MCSANYMYLRRADRRPVRPPPPFSSNSAAANNSFGGRQAPMSHRTSTDLLPENYRSGSIENTFHPKVPNLYANNSEGQNTSSTRDVYKAAASLYSVNTVDSAEWSQYSENDYPSPDPFDTERIFVSPPIENGTRYYSFVPHSPEGCNTDESQSASQNQNGAIPDCEYGNSPSFNMSAAGHNGSSTTNGSFVTNHCNESPTNKIVVKPPLELLKKRDEAFSWLDDALGGLSIGSTSKSSPSRSNTSSSSRALSEIETHSMIYSSSATSISNSSTLNSGDETWAGLSHSKIFSGSSTANSSNIQLPYVLPPPPTITRNNLSPGIGSTTSKQQGLVLPAYRPPPSPQNSLNYSSSSSSYAIQGNNYNGIMQAADILSTNVPAASRYDIMTALKQCNGSIAAAERLLKVGELFK